MDDEAQRIARAWFAHFDVFLASVPTPESLATILLPDGFWRDVCVAEWQTRSPRGIDAVHAWLSTLRGVQEGKTVKDTFGFLDLDAQTTTAAFQPVPWSTTKEQMVVARYTFRIRQDRGGAKPFESPCVGVVKLRCLEKKWRAAVIYQQLRPEESGCLKKDFTPVVIVGAGHAGLAAAATLQKQGVDSIVLESHPRIGYQWDNRANTLKLHTTKRFNTMPYLDYPHEYPQEMTKAHFAEFLRSYADSLKLNVRTSTRLVCGSASYDGNEWSMEVEDETHRYPLRSRHLILAAGMHMVPRALPENIVSSLKQFDGQVMHASQWPAWEKVNSGAEKGKKVVVVGMGNTGADIARDCCHRGAASVTMVQRGQLCAASTRLLHLVSEKAWPTNDDVHKGGRTMIESDLLVNSTPPNLFMEQLRSQVDMLDKPFDKTLLDQLGNAGIKLWWGKEGSGVFGFAAGQGAGHLWDAGLGALAGEGKIRVRQGVEVASIGPKKKIVYTDGSTDEADLLFFATGYEPPKHMLETILKERVDERVFESDEEGEMKGVWWSKLLNKPLYAAIGAFPSVRLHAPILAARISAEEQGRSAD